MDDPYAAAVMAAKAISSFGGSVLALIFQPPRTMREFWQRLIFSAGCGFAFGDTVRTEYLHWPESDPNVYASIVGVAAISWFVAPLALKLGSVIMAKMKAK